MYLYNLFISFLVALSFIAGSATAAQQPTDISNSCNELATATFTLKGLVLQMNSTANSGGADHMKDVYSQLDSIFDKVLDDVKSMSGSAVIQEPTAQQTVYGSFSNFVEALFELMDAFSGSAANFVHMDSSTEQGIPCELRALSGVVDAYLYNLNGLLSNSSYESEANGQKGQVDAHFSQAISSFHTSNGNGGSPNVTL